VVCTDGYGSSLAAATLVDLGFRRAGDLVGGIAAWGRAGFPLTSLKRRHLDASP
jgi:rhodanese-related sulfurtransferase